MQRPITRRMILKMGLVSAFLAACRTQPRRIPLMNNPPAIDYHYRGEVDTSRRKLIPIIENWPDSKTHEMAWSKEKGRAGKLRNTAIDRRPDSSVRDDSFMEVRSRIHTHPMLKNTINKARLCSIPSPHDIRRFIRLAFGENDPSKIVRVAHIIPISFEGKVMGFYTIRIGKKLIELMKNKPVDGDAPVAQIKKNNEDKKAFVDSLEMLDEMQKKYDNGVADTDQLYKEYSELLDKLQKAGLQIRVTPKNGYTFKDGYFQPKT